MTERQLRTILYDHLYMRRIPEPDYTKLAPAELNWLRNYYRQHQDHALGVGTLKFDLWISKSIEENNE